ncbi:uncharacterized protein V6R79_020935 [Siganus canaliculatus]
MTEATSAEKKTSPHIRMMGRSSSSSNSSSRRSRYHAGVCIMSSCWNARALAPGRQEGVYQRLCRRKEKAAELRQLLRGGLSL